MDMTSRAERAAAWLGPGLLTIALLALAAWSQGKWTDPVIDFGRELYVPWRLVEGDALYRDVASRNGPLSHHVNALWFTLFGVSVRTLVLCNLAILGGIVALVHRLLAGACGRWTATAAGLVLLAAFGFAQYVPIANYNYVTPYQHGQTHGLLLGLVVMLALVHGISGGRALAWSLAGLALGACFLTKAELFVPALAATILGLLLARGRRSIARSTLVLASSALLPIGLFTLYLGLRMPLAVAWSGVLGNWNHLGADLAGERFYAAGMGTDDVLGNGGKALAMFGVILGAGALFLVADRFASRLASGRARSVAVALGLALGLATWKLPWVPWSELARGWPLFAAGAFLVTLRRAWRARGDAAELRRLAPLALLSLYALALLGKMLLNARVYHYGFVLAMPATLLVVVGFVHALPRLAQRRHGGGALARALGVGAVSAFVLWSLEVSARHYALRDLELGSGTDRILVARAEADPRGRAMQQALVELEATTEPGSTLLVLPEGVILNYWLRRRNPSRFNLFLPPELAAAGGQDVMLDDVRADPPDTVVLVPRSFDEFGTGPFGRRRKSGKAILEWVQQHYEPLAPAEGRSVLILGRR